MVDEDAVERGSVPESEDASDIELAREIIDRHGLLSWIGVSLSELDDGRAVMELPHQEKFTNWVTGTIHGGVTATVVDVASAFALRSVVEDPYDVTLVTTDLNVKYVRPATTDLTITADVVRAGDTIGVTRVDVDGTAPEGGQKTVAIGETTYRQLTERGS